MGSNRGKVYVGMLLSVLLLGFLAMGCRGVQPSIVGKWRLVDSDEWIDFRQDRSLISTVGGGTYYFIDSSHVNIYLPEPGIGGLVGRKDYEVSFPDENTMVLKNANGNSWRFIRVEG